jgi:hypothetical protein
MIEIQSIAIELADPRGSYHNAVRILESKNIERFAPTSVIAFCIKMRGYARRIIPVCTALQKDCSVATQQISDHSPGEDERMFNDTYSGESIIRCGVPHDCDVRTWSAITLWKW